MDVDLLRLRYFVTVAEHLHFGRAAATLHIARPVLSRALTELEAELGVELFVRPAEHTELTDAGHALLDRARTLLAEDQAPDGTSSESQAVSPAFTIGIMPGVTVSKWTRLWAERKPDAPLRVLRTDAQTQVTVLHEGLADVSFVRLPVDHDRLSTIPLYSEVPVVVVPSDHPVALLEAVSVVDLVEEHLLQDPDTVPEWRDAATALRTGQRNPLPALRTTADAIALVAAGLGIVIVPQSVARANHRKDVTYRPVVDVAEHQVALAWVAERTTDEIKEFIGIVRGRSARSSRAPSSLGREQPERSGTGARPAKGATPRKDPSSRKPGKAAPRSRRGRGSR